MSIAGKTAKFLFEPFAHPYRAAQKMVQDQRKIIDLSADCWTVIKPAITPPTREMFDEALRPNREKALHLRAFYNVTQHDLETMHARHYWMFWGCLFGVIFWTFWGIEIAAGGFFMIPILIMVMIKESYEDYALRHCVVGGFLNWLTSGPYEWVVISTFEEIE
jgi:hypothetical protein